MKKIIVFLFIVFAGFLYAAGQEQPRTSDQGQPQEQEEAFRPLFSDVDNSASVQNDML